MITLAVSLGGVKSLIEVASGMTHPDKYMSSDERLEGGLGESLIRFRCVIIPCYIQGIKLVVLRLWLCVHFFASLIQRDWSAMRSFKRHGLVVSKLALCDCMTKSAIVSQLLLALSRSSLPHWKESMIHKVTEGNSVRFELARHQANCSAFLFCYLKNKIDRRLVLDIFSVCLLL